MKICCIQHVPFEKPGMIARWANLHGHAFTIAHPYAGESFPAVSEADMLVLMGGPMGVYEEARYPWLKAEKNWIEKAIQAGKKILGVCLGAQLVANVLGAKVYPHTQKEIGWFPVFPANPNPSDDWYARLFDPAVTVFHWHGDTFELPAGAVHHVCSTACQHQLFSWSSQVLGLQFHLEVSEEDIQSMLNAGGKAEIHQALAQQPKAPFIQKPEAILAQTPRHTPACQERLFRLLQQFTEAGKS